MPKHEQTISLNNIDKETALAISYQAMKGLNWIPQYAGEEKLLGNTPKDWKNFPLQVMITVVNDTLTVSSEMVSGESFDMRGKNKKATTAFLAAFETAKNTIDANAIENNKAIITTLREATAKAAEQEQQQAAEIDKAMNLSGSNLYITYAIIAINIVVFILMAMDGAGIFEANGLVHIKWGSNFTPLTLSGDWWRLISNVFIHFGVIHLLMNMYCLYMVGVYLEPMLGKIKYTVAYLCTGIAASIISLWWHSDGVNSAGASGAIFGMYGLFLALLSTNLIPKQMRASLLQSIGIFVVYNLVYGMKSGVDNAAHVGGLVSGFVIGYLYVFGIKKEKEGKKLQWIIPLVVLLTAGSAYGYLNQNVASAEQRNAGQNIVKDAAFKDNEKYNQNMINFSATEEKALTALQGTDSISREEFVVRLDQALPLWDSAANLIKATEGYNISEENHKEAGKFLRYAELRKKQYILISDLNKADPNNEDSVKNNELKEINKEILEFIKE